MIIMTKLTFPEYQEKVFDYLEYLGYPAYVIGFDPNDVAKSMAGACISMFALETSYRMCAIVIFSLTLTMQVMRYDGKAN